MKNSTQILTTIAALFIIMFAVTSFKSTNDVKVVNASGSDIEIQYCGSQKFYVLKNGSYNVAFIKAN